MAVKLSVAVRNARLNAVETEIGVDAVFRIGRTRGGNALLELTDSEEITLTGSVAEVAFNASDIGAVGRMFGELRVEIDGRGMIVSTVQLNITKRIQEAAE